MGWFGRVAGDECCVDVPPVFEILSQDAVDRVGLQQTILMPLLWFEGEDAQPVKRQTFSLAPPIAGRGMNRVERDHVGPRKPGPVKDSHDLQNPTARHSGLVDDPAYAAPRRTAREPGSFP